MNFYMAPLEGITGWVFRQALNTYFGEGITAFFSPFIVYHEKRALTARDVNNISPANNAGFKLIPQVLTNSVHDYLCLEREIADLGYDEVNLNIGCPSKTVSSKGRGSGFLRYPEELDAFLDGVYSQSSGRVKISVKTRIGWESPEEWEELLAIYNKYPISELTIHPRTGVQMYQGQVHFESFEYALVNAKMPLCYNGDLKTVEGFQKLSNSFNDKVESVMIGRGILEDPALIRKLNGGAAASKEELYAFVRMIKEGYLRTMDNETQTLFKMKEVWNFLKTQFPEEEYEKAIKKIRKSKRLTEYDAGVMEIFC